MRDRSAYRSVLKALTDRLTRPDVHVGRTADYPRVEIHSLVANSGDDKAGDVRIYEATIETMTTDSKVSAAEINNANEELLLSTPLDLPDRGFQCFGVTCEQLQDLDETSDTQNLIYRVLLMAKIYVIRNN